MRADDPDDVLFWYFIYFPILYFLTFLVPLGLTMRLSARVADEFSDPAWFRPVAAVFVVLAMLAVVGACYYAPYSVVRHAYGAVLALLFAVFVTLGVLGLSGRST